MRRRLYHWIAVVVLLGTMGAPALTDTAAQEPSETPASPALPKFSIRSVGDYENLWFDVTIEAGETMELTAAIRNIGDVNATLRTYAANASNPPNGGFSAGTETDEPAGATVWLDYPGETFEARPGEAHEVDFTVAVPAGTPPGEYVAALVVQTAEPVGIPGGAMFEQVIRNTISVEMTVPGEMTAGFELGEPLVSLAGDQWVLSVPVTNTGTARLRPQGELVVTTSQGDKVVTSTVEMGSVYGGNTTSVRIGLPAQVPPGDYLVTVNLADVATGATDAIYIAAFTLAEPASPDPPPVFTVEEVFVIPNGDPLRYADVSATISNNGQAIPTANVTLNVMRDGETVESYPLAENQALLQGRTDFDQRYIPVDDWQSGKWSFELVVASVNGGTETILATVDVPDEITVP